MLIYLIKLNFSYLNDLLYKSIFLTFDFLF